MESLRVAVVVGSVREGRFGPVIVRWFTGLAQRHPGVEVDVVDLLGLPEGEFAGRVGLADAVVVVTPEYNHSFPGPLKTQIDSAYVQWQAKPVGFVSYGGVSGGLRAVEQLRLVFAELGGVTVRETVSFHGPHGQFDGAGVLREPAAAEGAVKRLLDQLVWWGVTLREARAVRPYQV